MLSAVWGRLASVPGGARGGGGSDLLSRAAAGRDRRAARAGVEGETLDAIHDHNDIRDAVAEVTRHQVGTDEWFGAVAGGEPGQRRSHGRGGTRGTDRLPPAGRVAAAAISSRSPLPPTKRGTSPGSLPWTRTRPHTCARRKKRARAPDWIPEHRQPQAGLTGPGPVDPFSRGSVAVQRLGLVFVPGGGGAVGVQDQGPARRVDHHLVVKPAQQHAVLDAGRAAVGLVPGVVPPGTPPAG